MEIIIELVKVLSKHKIKTINLIEPIKLTHPDKVHKLYLKLINKEIKNEKDALIHFGYTNKNNRSYRNLKANLKNRLYNSLMFVDLSMPSFSEAQKAFYSSQRNVSIIKILLGRYIRKPAIELIAKTLRLSRKYNLTEISLELCRLMRNHHALKTGNKSKFNFYKKEVEKYEQILFAENLAVKYFEELSIELVRTTGNINEYLNNKYSEYLNELDSLSKKINSFKFHWIRYYYILNLYKYRKEYLNVLDVCNEALYFFEQKENVAPVFLGQFLYFKLVYLILVKQYDLGLKIAEDCLNQFEKGSINWYNSLSMYFILSNHSRAYEKALEIFNIIIEYKNLKYQSAKLNEIWKINEAYLYYLYLIDKISPTEDSNLKSFRLTKFLNEVPIFSTDKRGYNIPILIIQILILIHKKRYKKLSDKMDAIEKYTSRYLRKNDHYRSNCFIRMLIQIPKRNFHRKAVTRHAKPYLDKLRSVPLEIANQPYEIEIIPYEHLWEFTLDSLDNKFH